MNTQKINTMDYNQPFQHLSFAASKAKDVIYLRSKVIILAKAGTTFSRISITDSQGNPVETSPSVSNTSFIITYKQLSDQSRTTNSNYSDITDIVLLEKVNIDSSATPESIRKLIFDKVGSNIVFKVVAKIRDCSPTGEVTTTLTELSDIEIV